MEGEGEEGEEALNSSPALCQPASQSALRQVSYDTWQPVKLYPSHRNPDPVSLTLTLTL